MRRFFHRLNKQNGIDSVSVFLLANLFLLKETTMVYWLGVVAPDFYGKLALRKDEWAYLMDVKYVQCDANSKTVGSHCLFPS